MSAKKKCLKCRGDGTARVKIGGRVWNTSSTCEKCDGTGQVEAKEAKRKQELSTCHNAPTYVHASDEGTNYYVCTKCEKPCERCGGDGEIGDGKSYPKVCPNCRGTGFVKRCPNCKSPRPTLVYENGRFFCYYTGNECGNTEFHIKHEPKPAHKHEWGKPSEPSSHGWVQQRCNGCPARLEQHIPLEDLFTEEVTAALSPQSEPSQAESPDANPESNDYTEQHEHRYGCLVCGDGESLERAIADGVRDTIRKFLGGGE